jgi:hypothetical protein
MTNDQIPQSQPLPSAPPAAYPAAPPTPYAQAPYAPPVQPARDAKAQMIAFALFGAAAIALVGLVTKSWFTVPEGGIGLTGVEACHRGQCMSISLGDIPKIPGDIPLFAWLALLSGLAAVGSAAAMGGMLLANKAAKIPLVPINIVFGLAGFSTTMFLFRLYNEEKGLSFGWSGITAIISLVVIGGITKQAVTPRVKGAA